MKQEANKNIKFNLKDKLNNKYKYSIQKYIFKMSNIIWWQHEISYLMRYSLIYEKWMNKLVN